MNKPRLLDMPESLTPMDKATMAIELWVGTTPETAVLRLWHVPPTLGYHHLIAAHWVDDAGWHSWRCFAEEEADGSLPLPYETLQMLPVWLIERVAAWTQGSSHGS